MARRPRPTPSRRCRPGSTTSSATSTARRCPEPWSSGRQRADGARWDGRAVSTPGASERDPQRATGRSIMTTTDVLAKPAAPRPRSARVLDWLTTTDHKKIGIMYLVNSFTFFAFAGALAMLMRTQLASPDNNVLSPKAFNEAFTMHGTIMIFLVILPLLSGFGNYFVPLQIGALDMAFPRVNAASFWLLPVGGLTVVAGYLTKGG